MTAMTDDRRDSDELRDPKAYEIMKYRRMDYGYYLRTEHWKQVKLDALDRAGHKCQVCGSIERLQVHHNTYERRGQERPEDVIVLCHDCHTLFHQHGKLRGPQNGR